MSIKYNKFGEVVSVNGIVTGHHLGAPMQDAKPKRPEDNDVYATEMSVQTTIPNSDELLEEQPKPSGGASSWNDLTDKPFYEETVTVGETVTMKKSGTTSYYYQDLRFTRAIVKNPSCAVFNIDGIEYSLTGEVEKETFVGGSTWYFEIRNNETGETDGFRNVFIGFNQYDEPNKQISIVNYQCSSMVLTVMMEQVNVTPLDEKYMPLLTSPNGTKYKLTVADNGTLTATAV